MITCRFGLNLCSILSHVAYFSGEADWRRTYLYRPT